MATQLTLFGRIPKVDPYFNTAKTDYEKFINKNWEVNNKRFSRKQDFLKAALKEWDAIKSDKNALRDYIEREIPPPPKRSRKSFFLNSPSAAALKASPIPTTINPLLTTHEPPSSSNLEQPQTLNVPTDISTRDDYLNENEYVLIRKVLSGIGAQNLDDFFTEDVINDSSLMKTLAAFSYSVDFFNSLRTTYDSLTKKDRKSSLKAKLTDIDLLFDELNAILNECASCKKLPTMDSTMLCRTYLRKAEIVKDVILKAGQINLKVSDSSTLNDLRRRIKQQQKSGGVDLTCRTPNELTECFCYNDCNLTWEAAFDRIIGMENSNVTQQPLNFDQLMRVADILSENVVTSQKELEIS